MDIQARTRRSLEWERLVAYLASESCTPWSRELCLSPAMHDDVQAVERLLCQTDEALAMLSAGFGLSQEGLCDLRPVLDRLRTAAPLAQAELLDLRGTLILAKRARAQLSQLAVETFPQLSAFHNGIQGQDDLLQALNEVFDDDGNVREDASPLLRSLRRDLHRLNNRTRDELQKMINNATTAKALQEPLYTQRNGRYVLPVQASMRGAVQGIVHDSSASGLTVYVEPLAVVELTNSVRLKEGEIEREIERLLSELSAKAAERYDPLQQSYRLLVELDFIAARARLARLYEGVKPALSDDGRLSLKQARHPLLVLQSARERGPNSSAPLQVVPNDIVLGGDCRTLVITGPNTGGKTVYLKTAGLLSFMVKAGLLLPVQPGSSAALFQDIFADIGDEQSIEANLSTFSSHMTNIIQIVERAHAGTLVLLDEIGAGTDPKEGAILARTILEKLNDSGALTISTTHYGEMKTLAYTMGGFINGSFDFDEEHLSPTYHLRIGIPGSSKAIAIAARLGLAAPLIESARRLLDAADSDMQQMIDELERRLVAVKHDEKELEKQKQQLGEEAAVLTEAKAKLAAERERLRAGLAGAMESELETAKDLVRSLIADLQKQPSIARAQKVQKELSVLREELGWLEPQAEQADAGQRFQVGQSVKVKSLNQNGIIEALPDGGKPSHEAQATVRSGAMKIRVPLADLLVLGSGVPSSDREERRTRIEPSGKSRVKQQVSAVASGSDVFVRTSGNTLDLRGERVEAALALLERFIDGAFLAHTSPVMVIHGHGTGQLRLAVRQFLDSAPYEAIWRPGESYEGGDGVTVVRFGAS